MTVQTLDPPAPPIETNHPVRSFVVVLLALVVALLALQLSGAVLPRVTNFQGQQGSLATNGQVQWTAAVIRNDAPLPVEIESVEWPTRHASDLQVDVLPEGEIYPAGPPAVPTGGAPFTLAGGEKRVVVVSGDTPCAAFDTGDIELVVRTAAGLTRRVVVEGTAADPGACPGPEE
jgi:hypothetical protein